jgi:hypothetical protein
MLQIACLSNSRRRNGRQRYQRAQSCRQAIRLQPTCDERIEQRKQSAFARSTFSPLEIWSAAWRVPAVKAVAFRPHNGWNYDDKGVNNASFLLNTHFCNSRFPILSSTVATAVYPSFPMF